ncbi:hypothetical protein ACQJBY_054155 [Aegilops geniculata]
MPASRPSTAGARAAGLLGSPAPCSRCSSRAPPSLCCLTGPPSSAFSLPADPPAAVLPHHHATPSLLCLSSTSWHPRWHYRHLWCFVDVARLLALGPGLGSHVPAVAAAPEDQTRGMCAPLLVSWTTSTSTMTLDVYELCITTAGVIFVKSDYDVHDYIRCGFCQVPLRICQVRLHDASSTSTVDPVGVKFLSET